MTSIKITARNGNKKVTIEQPLQTELKSLESIERVNHEYIMCLIKEYNDEMNQLWWEENKP